MSGRHRIGGEFVADVFERELETIREALGIGDGFGQIAKERTHFTIALQVAFGVLREETAGGVEMGVFADAGEDVENFAAARSGVLHAVAGDHREAKFPGEIEQGAIGSFFTAHEVPLNLHVNVVVAETVEQRRGVFGVA